jgi:uncharacterized protein with PCYCGC motif
MVAGGAALALIAVVLLTRSAGGTTHPEPRAGITAEQVLVGAAIPNTPGAAQAYAAARSAPATLDGVYCHCDCSKHAGHRSLLTCFQTDHGAYCDICMGEAVLAAQLAARGSSLQTIREAIDRQFGS